MNEEKRKHWFSQIQYDLFIRCSEKQDMTKWNKWRKEHPDEEILLRSADLGNAYLLGAHLEKADLAGANLEGAYLVGARLENADLVGANLEKADLREAHLEGANLVEAHLESASFILAHLENASLREAHLEGADLAGANLEGADLTGANLESANLLITNLNGTNLDHVNLMGAKLESVYVNSSTILRRCTIDRYTYFGGVTNLDSIMADSDTKEILRYNSRRLNWEKWYTDHPFGRWPIRFFWWISDYGLSTSRILAAFIILAFLFVVIYYAYGAWDYYYLSVKEQPGIVKNLFANDEGQVPNWLVPLRAFYFSIVTMTTLGFGDMCAHAQRLEGHLFLMAQVLLGYIILGLLVTRFSVMIRSGGPQATKFARMKSKEYARAQRGKTGKPVTKKRRVENG